MTSYTIDTLYLYLVELGLVTGKRKFTTNWLNHSPSAYFETMSRQKSLINLDAIKALHSKLLTVPFSTPYLERAIRQLKEHISIKSQETSKEVWGLNPAKVFQPSLTDTHKSLARGVWS